MYTLVKSRQAGRAGSAVRLAITPAPIWGDRQPTSVSKEMGNRTKL